MRPGLRTKTRLALSGFRLQFRSILHGVLGLAALSQQQIEPPQRLADLAVGTPNGPVDEVSPHGCSRISGNYSVLAADGSCGDDCDSWVVVYRSKPAR